MQKVYGIVVGVAEVAVVAAGAIGMVLAALSLI